VDGASTDDTAAIAARYPFVRMIQETGRGYASAWNDGIRAATGTHIAFLDSDDRWVVDKLQMQVAALADDPLARCVIGHVQFFAEPGRPLPPSFKPQLLERSHVAYMPGALLVHRSVFDDVGLFDPSWTIANDIDWFAELKDKAVRVAIVPHVLIHKRVHDGNVSYLAARSPQVNTEILRLLRRSIHRQRDGSAVGSDGSTQ
jgi:glycosyltransferase involved in cell wall biosynthesis